MCAVCGCEPACLVAGWGRRRALLYGRTHATTWRGVAPRRWLPAVPRGAPSGGTRAEARQRRAGGRPAAGPPALRCPRSALGKTRHGAASAAVAVLPDVTPSPAVLSLPPPRPHRNAACPPQHATGGRGTVVELVDSDISGGWDRDGWGERAEGGTHPLPRPSLLRKSSARGAGGGVLAATATAQLPERGTRNGGRRCARRRRRAPARLPQFGWDGPCMNAQYSTVGGGCCPSPPPTRLWRPIRMHVVCTAHSYAYNGVLGAPSNGHATNECL